VVALPLLALAGVPPAAAWPYVAASVAIHMAYYVTLDGAYRHGELGLTYPIMRGSAPMLVALGSSVVIGEQLGAGHWAGVVAITTGVALVGLSHLGDALHHRRALGFAFANASVIACYTFVDGLGVRTTVAAGHGAAAYVMLLFVLDGIPYPAFVLWRRSAGAGASPASAAPPRSARTRSRCGR
jgi:drug/metabolite transporter (DMT)-like permease